MKKSLFKNKEEMPLFITINEVADLLGISREVAYKLSRIEGFPKLKLTPGRTIIPRDKLLEWLDEQTKKEEINL